MRRRQLLAALAAAPAVAGCLSSAGLPGDRDDTETPTPSGDSWGECPSFVERADRTVCYVGSEIADVTLRPSTTEFVEDGSDDDVETMTFTLENDGDGPFKLNPHDWAVYRRSDGGWTRVAPDEHVDPLYEVPAGETYEWVLGTQEHSSPMSENSSAVVVDLTSADRYAFRVHGWFGDVEGAVRIELVARFEYLLAVAGH